MMKRQLISLFVVIIAIDAVCCTTLCAADSPHVLFIAIDDLNDWIGCLDGHPQAYTPNIDRLAKRGVLFANAHCAAPACNPSRAAVFSGQRPERTGIFSNSSPRLRSQLPELITLPQWLARSGYQTFGTGKLLHGGGESGSVVQEGFFPEQRWSPFQREQVKYTKEELPSKGTSNPRHVVSNAPGGGEIVLPLNRMPSDRKPDGDDGESFDWGSLNVPDDQMGDGQITNWASELLSQKRDGPMFLAVGYYRPHIPLFAPAKYFDRFDTQSIQLPPILSNDLDDLSELARRWATEAVTAGSHATVLKYNQWKDAVAAYLACVHFVDAQVGQLMAALDSGPHAENTVVVLWSDHGWHLGEKQHWGKWTGWERSTRVPLIIAPPKQAGFRAGAVCQQPVSLLDLYPTLVQLCGVDSAPHPLDGQSLVPLLSSPNQASGRTVTTTFDEGNHSVRSQRWRYVRYNDGSQELYDLAADPNEWANVAGDAQHARVIAQLKQQLPGN